MHVEQVLAESENGRNDDVYLIRVVLANYYPHLVQFGAKTGREFVDLNNREAVSMFSKIERCRRKVQETKYFPTVWQIAKRRRINEEVWRNYMGGKSA